MNEHDIENLSDEHLLKLCEESKIAGHPIGLELIKRFKDKNKKIREALILFKKVEQLADEIIKDNI